MKLGAWPRPITGQDFDHVLKLGDGRIFCGHGATANRLDCLNAGVVSDLTEIASTNLAWVWSSRWHQGSQNLWKGTKEIKFFRQPREMAARDCAANDRSAEVPTTTSGISYGTPLALRPYANPSIQAAKYSPPPPSTNALSLPLPND